MKAVQANSFGGPEVLELKDIPTPEPEKNQVRVRLYAAGINPSEAYTRTGTFYFCKPSIPYVPGCDGAGIIDKTGAGVENLFEGQRVFVAALQAKRNTGTYAEYVVCDETAVMPLPEGISFEQGACVGTPALTAYRALYYKAGIRPGETVLIHGASGAMGTAASQFANAAGLTVFGTCGSAETMPQLYENGVHGAFNHNDRGHFEEILDLTDGKGVDVIIESLANVNLENDASILSMGGRIVVVGNRGTIEFNPRLLMIKDSSVIGMSIYNAEAKEYSGCMRAVLSAMEHGFFRPVVGGRYGLGEAAKAHGDLLGGGFSKGNIIFSIR